MRALASKEKTHISTLLTPISNNIPKLEINLVIHIACHSSINSIDRLTDFMKNEIGSSSKKALLRLHRTKYTALIKKVIAPVLLDELVGVWKIVKLGFLNCR